METSCVVVPNDVGARANELWDLVALPSERERPSNQLTGSVNELLGAVAGVIDNIVLRVIEQQTAENFDKERREAFPQYFSAMVALGTLIKITVPERDIDWLASQSLSELEADFRDLGAAKFGTDLRDRGLFTVWTLRKIQELGSHLKSDQAGENAKKFAIHAVWARFHIDCLLKSIRSNRPIFPEVAGSIVDGLRSAVDAYAWLRQEVDRINGVAPEGDLPPIRWDEEDEILLSDSMRTLDNKC